MQSILRSFTKSLLSESKVFPHKALMKVVSPASNDLVMKISSAPLSEKYVSRTRFTNPKIWVRLSQRDDIAALIASQEKIAASLD